MTFRYRIVPEQRLIIQRYTGLVSMADVIRSSETMWADPLYDKTYNGISDLRESRTTAGPGDVLTLVKHFWHPCTSVGRWAALFSEPRTTALGILFSQATLMMVLGIEVFSTWEAACGYLQVQAQQLELE